jgi:hypothetical protein
VRAAFDLTVCRHCRNTDKCPALKINGMAELMHTPKEMRLTKRLFLEQTDRLKKRYA